ncbi:MAG: UvrD-helicase domain-containing protein [Thermoleophilia bacterium]|nr:UvrD-helicase domain-containing protein [Thermoleophilia bacterium]
MSSVASPEQYLANLNPAQREAVLHTEGPLLVIAGAGSGKTRVLTHRVAHLITAVGVKPNEILAITFTNKAAGEMRERLTNMLGPVARAIWILTFHAACGRILRSEAERLGYKSNFTIYDSADQVRLVKQVLEELDKDPKRFVPRGVHAQISNAKNQLITPAKYAEQIASFYDQTVAEAYELYQKRLAASNAVDFDDMLMLTVQILESFPDARTKWQRAFRYVMVDEYQDTNHAQYRLLQLLAEEHHNVCAVGDPDQCLVAGTMVTLADGSTKPIEQVRVGDDVLSGYGSGRFGPAAVTRVRESSRRDGVEIVTAGGRRIRSTPEHVHFAGFKVGRTPQLHMTYLMWKRGVGFRIGVSRTYTNRAEQTLAGPALRMNQEHADATWVVSVHEREADARVEETLLSLRYALPTVPFVARPQGAAGGVVGDQAAFDRIFGSLETETGGRNLLEDEGLSFDHPHFTAATTTVGSRTRRRLTLALCGDGRGGRPRHRVSLFGYDEEGRETLEGLGLSLRPAYRGSQGWRYETCSADLPGLARTIADIEAALPVSVRYTARLGISERDGGKERNALPFMPASAVRRGMVMIDEDGRYDLVERVDRVVLDQPVYDLDVERTHNFVANGLLTHNSIYAFRGADIRNILEFERDFPETRTIALEQNYRSTNAILEAANAVIDHNSERKPKRLWSELGEGDPVRVVEVEDEQAEARYVAAQIAGLVDEGYAGSEIAVFYRMNAQSRVLEQTLRLHQIGYQVIGGPRFYERAEVKDAIAYLQVLDNPADAVSLMRIANRPKRGIGDTTISRLVSYADSHGLTLYEALGHPAEAGLGTAAVKAVTSLRTLLDSLRSAAQEEEVPELLQTVLERTGTLEAYEAERTIEARGRIENLEAFVDGAREYAQQAEEPTLSGFLQEISLYSDQDALGEEQSNVTLMTIHNAKGLEFRAVFVVGVEEEIFPSARSIEEQGIEEERRLFYVGLTRAEERLTLTHASSRLLWGRTTAHLPSRFLDELPDRHVDRERLRPSSWRSYGTPAQTRDIQPRSDQPDLSTGDSVRHGTLGEGVITRIEPGSVVTVRFASDGSERKLMLDYAPLQKID